SNQAVVWRSGSVTKLIKDVRSTAERLFRHRRQKQLQRVAINELIATLEEGNMIMVADFQERYTHDEQDEVQFQHWNRDSTTLFPVPVFFKLNGEVWVSSSVVLSDDKLQDNAWVQHTFTRLLQTEIPSMLERVGATRMTRVIVVTDNCGKHFKCATSFGYIGDCKVYVIDQPGSRIDIEAHYFDACHGKSVSDSEGGVVETFARNQVLRGRMRILSSFDLFEKLVPEL
ncbi:unnamed protein product, partial [Sphacelaria rigidula]